MNARPLLAILMLALSAACSTPATAIPAGPTGGPLSVAISPNPLALPAPGQPLVWNVTLRALGSVGVRLDRSEISVLDGVGGTVAERETFWSKSAGCSVCSDDIHLASGAGMTFSGQTVTFSRVPGGKARLSYKTFFTDDDGNASSITVEVPVG